MPLDLKGEFGIKLDRMKKFAADAGVDGIALGRTDNFAWATCGGEAHVNTAQDAAAAVFLLVGDKPVVVTSTIERGRLLEEELGNIGVEVAYHPWEEDRGEFMKKEFTGGKKILSDMPVADFEALPSNFTDLHFELTETEIIRYRVVGAKAGHAIQNACKEIEAGMSEMQIAGLVANQTYRMGAQPIVVLVAVDDRISKYRHPLPTERNKLEKTAMVVLCARRGGMIASCTRMVNVGEPTDELAETFAKCVFVDVVMNTLTMPGTRIGDIFKAAMDSYWEVDCAQEWTNHHQGGQTGYKTRYFLANEKSDEKIIANSAYAWNPSITGAKSEDTLLVLPEHNEFITQAPDWPTIEIEGDNMTIARPDILVL